MLRPGMACFQEDLASASPRQAADELRTRASEICSRTVQKYACRCPFVLFSDVASQLEQFDLPNKSAFECFLLICRACL